MNHLVADHSREDAARRMRLLEMAGGDLRKAAEMEQWVLVGDVPALAVATAPKTAPGTPVEIVLGQQHSIAAVDLEILPFLRRNPCVDATALEAALALARKTG